MIVAKAAIDRLLEAEQDEFADTRAELRSALSQCLWMVLPLSANPSAPAQGALAIEIALASRVAPDAAGTPSGSARACHPRGRRRPPRPRWELAERSIASTPASQRTPSEHFTGRLDGENLADEAPPHASAGPAPTDPSGSDEGQVNRRLFPRRAEVTPCFAMLKRPPGGTIRRGLSTSSSMPRARSRSNAVAFPVRPAATPTPRTITCSEPDADCSELDADARQQHANFATRCAATRQCCLTASTSVS